MVSAALLGLTVASVPYSVDSLDDLYRLQRLYQLSQLPDDPYLPILPIHDDDDEQQQEAAAAARSLWGGDEGGTGEDDMVEGGDIYGSPLFTGAQARDEEHLEHSALQGLHRVSGQ